MYLPLFVGVLCWPLFWYALHYVLSSFAIILMRKRELIALLLVFWMSCYCKCPVALPQGAVGWSAVCDCGNSWSYSLTFCRVMTNCDTKGNIFLSYSHTYNRFFFLITI